jgi:hypothetical protein
VKGICANFFWGNPEFVHAKVLTFENQRRALSMAGLLICNS